MQSWLLVSGIATIPRVGGTTNLYPGTVLFVDEWESLGRLGGVWNDYTAIGASRVNPPAGKVSFVCVSRAGGVRNADGTAFFVGPGSIVIVDLGVTIPLSAGAWISVPTV